MAVGTMCAAIACGGGSASSPMQPSPAATAPLGDGRFLLELLGGSFECDDFKVPQAGTHIMFTIAATHDGGTWIGHAATADSGSFELRLGRSAEPNPSSGSSIPLGPFDIPVVGTLTGIATDSYLPLPGYVLSGTSPVFGERTDVFGAVHTAGAIAGTIVYADGRTRSPMTFTRNAVSSTCPAGQVGWILNGPLTTGATR